MLRSRLHYALLALLLVTPATLGQGRVYIDRPIRPAPRPNLSPQLDIKYLRIESQITDGVAETTVRQTFHNNLPRQVEGTYIFPLPDGAAVGDFEMTVGGKTLRGEVLDVDQARQTYERIVRQARDPGLLEYLGGRLYKARVFPIPPKGDVEVKLSYSQTLREVNGLGLLEMPLRVELPAGKTVGQLVVDAKLKSTLPLTTVFCPSHNAEVIRDGENAAHISYEVSGARPDRNMLIYYQRKDAQFGLSMLTHRTPGEDGYFLLRIAPQLKRERAALPKDIVFVVDKSGSMSDGKLEQAQAALRQCIAGLGDEDRFNILAFSTDVRPLDEGLVAANDEQRARAKKFVDELSANGGTNINQALLRAIDSDPQDATRPFLIVFMTDGLPTVEITDVDVILDNVERRNTDNVRIHVLGVGTDVNTRLLDTLAERTRATREYCVEDEELELKLSGLVARLSEPVLAAPSLLFDKLKVRDVYPRELPDLFKGTDLVVLGRYETTGHHAIKLKGQAGDAAETLTFEGTFPKAEDGADFLPRLWATRKVGYLLDEIRLHGENGELVDEVKRLAKRFGIVTPYTASLIVEDSPVAFGFPRGGAFGAERGRNPYALGDVQGNGGGAWYFDASRDFGEPAGEMLPPPEIAHERAGEPLKYPTNWREVRRARGGREAATRAVTTPDGRITLHGAADETSEVDYFIHSLYRQAESGAAAVEASVLLDTLKKVDTTAYRGPVTLDGQPIIRHVGVKTFVFDGRRWLDTSWDGKAETTPIEAFSAAYFELLRTHDKLRQYLALGENVVIVVDETVYEIMSPPVDDDPNAPAEG